MYHRFEGDLLRQGAGRPWDYTPRELCNMVYASIVSDVQPPMDEKDPSVEEQIRDFEEAIGMRVNPQSRAMDAWRNQMLLLGKDPDNMEMPADLADRIARDNDDGVPDWMKEEREEEFSGPKGRKKPAPPAPDPAEDPWSGWGDIEFD